MELVLTFLASAILAAGASAAEAVTVVDPAQIGYVYVGDTEPPDHPTGSGIYKVEVIGPTRREHKWGGGLNVKIPLTGLQPGDYVIRAYDGLGNVTEKKIRISRFVAGPTEPSQIVRSTAAPFALPPPQQAAKTLLGPPECRILTFGPADAKTSQIFTANDNNGCLWDPDQGTAVSLALPGETMGAVPLGRPGRFLVTGQRGMRILDLETRRMTAFDMGGREFSASWPQLSPDGKILAVGGQEFLSKEDWNKRAFPVLVWNLARPGPPKAVMDFETSGGIPACLCFSPDGKILVVRGRDLHFVDTRTWKTIETFPMDFDASATSCQFAPDGSKIYLGMGDGIQLYRRAKNGRWSPSETWLRESPGKGEVVRLSPDGTRLASVSNYRLLRMWDAKLGNILWTAIGHESWMRDMRFSPDGRRISVSSYVDGSLRTWDAATGRLELLMKPEPRKDFE